MRTFTDHIVSGDQTLQLDIQVHDEAGEAARITSMPSLLDSRREILQVILLVWRRRNLFSSVFPERRDQGGWRQRSLT